MHAFRFNPIPAFAALFILLTSCSGPQARKFRGAAALDTPEAYVEYELTASAQDKKGRQKARARMGELFRQLKIKSLQVCLIEWRDLSYERGSMCFYPSTRPPDQCTSFAHTNNLVEEVVSELRNKHYVANAAPPVSVRFEHAGYFPPMLKATASWTKREVRSERKLSYGTGWHDGIAQFWSAEPVLRDVIQSRLEESSSKAPSTAPCDAVLLVAVTKLLHFRDIPGTAVAPEMKDVYLLELIYEVFDAKGMRPVFVAPSGTVYRQTEVVSEKTDFQRFPQISRTTEWSFTEDEASLAARAVRTLLSTLPSPDAPPSQ